MVGRVLKSGASGGLAGNAARCLGRVGPVAR